MTNKDQLDQLGENKYTETLFDCKSRKRSKKKKKKKVKNNLHTLLN